MKFVDSNFEILEQGNTIKDIYKHIEKIARISYKSEDKITDDSAEKMINSLINNKHYACLEHGTVYFIDDLAMVETLNNFTGTLADKYSQNKFSRVVYNGYNAYITTNIRVLLENGWLDDLQYMCEPTKWHEKRYSVRFVLSAGIGREFTRHRAFSFMQESTRYCNYSKGKFNNELTFVIPQWIYDCRNERASYCNSLTGKPMDWLAELNGQTLVKQLCCEDRSVASYVELLKHIEKDYMFLITSDESYTLKAQEARGILPLDIKSELVMTGFASDWIHFFNLRSYIAMTGKSHPDAMILANNLLNEFLERDYIKYETLYNKHNDSSEMMDPGYEKTS